MCDFMDYTGSIILWIFFVSFLPLLVGFCHTFIIFSRFCLFFSHLSPICPSAEQFGRTALYCCLEGQPRLLRGVGRLWLVMRKHRFILWRNYRESNIIEEGHKCRLIHIEVDKTYYLCFLLSSSTTNISDRPNSPLQNISDKNLIKTYLKIALNFELSQKSILLNLLTFSL